LEPNRISNKIEAMNNFSNQIGQTPVSTSLNNINNMNTFSGSFGKNNNFFNSNTNTNTNTNVLNNNFSSSMNPTNTNNFFTNSTSTGNNMITNTNNTFSKPSGSISFLNNINKNTEPNFFISGNTPKTNTNDWLSKTSTQPSNINFFPNSTNANPLTFGPNTLSSNNHFSSGNNLTNPNPMTFNPSNSYNTQNNHFLNPSFNTNINSGHNPWHSNSLTSNNPSYNFFPNSVNTDPSKLKSFSSNIDLLNKTNSVNFYLNNAQKYDQKNVHIENTNLDFLGVYALTKRMGKGNYDITGKEENKNLKFKLPEEFTNNVGGITFYPVTTTINYNSTNYNEKPTSSCTNFIFNNNNIVNNINLTHTIKPTKTVFPTENNKIKQKENIFQTDTKESKIKKKLIPEIKPLETLTKKVIVNDQKSFANECLPLLNELFKKEREIHQEEEFQYKREYIQNKNLVKLNFSINEKNFNEAIQIKVSNLHTIGKLKEFLAEIISEKIDFETKAEDLEIISKHACVKNDEVIKDKEFFNENETLIIILTENFSSKYEARRMNKESIHSIDSIEKKNDFESKSINLNSNFSENLEEKKVMDHFSNLDEGENEETNYKPILTKSGYYTEPSFNELIRMKKQDLERVENFSISNEYGRIEFPGFTDLTYVNLDEAVNIDFRCISIYNDCIIPEEGQKLNRKAILKFYQYFLDQEVLDNNKELKKFVDMLDKMAESLNVKHCF
jgi:hypothetical protein